MKQLLLLLLGVLIALPAAARDFKYEYEGQTLTYTVLDENAKTCQTKAGTSSKAGSTVFGNLIIPEIVKDGNDEFTVIAIGDYAFYNLTSLFSVIIPNSVQTIGDCAFNSCSGLTSINIPSTVTAIRKDAFYKSWNINYAEFADIKSLCLIDFSNQYSNPLQTAKHLYIAGEEITEVVIPEGIKTLNYTFRGCEYLTSVEIPNSVTSIGNRAFYGCQALTQINIPESVTSIGEDAFFLCSSLTQINIPESVTSIGDGAFSICSSLSQINIPESVTSIGYESFKECTSLTQINIPENVTSIGNYAFSDCSDMRVVYINNPKITISSNTFSGCNNISDIFLNFSNPEQFSDKINNISETASLHIYPSLYSLIFASDWEYKDRVAKDPFTVDGIHYDWEDKDNLTLKITGFDSDVETVTFNETVYDFPIVAFDCVMKDYPTITHIIYNRLTIPEDFCKDMTNLKILELGEQVSSIGDNAFAGVNLETVSSTAAVPPTLGENAFEIPDPKPQLYVSSESAAAYSDTDQWSEYFDIYLADNATNPEGWGYDIISAVDMTVRLTSIPENIEGDELTIPATIEVNGHTAQVVELGITSVPSGTAFASLRIKDSALPLTQSCDLSTLISCTKVYIGRDIQPAADYEGALYGYNRITEVTFGNNVTKVGDRMFKGSRRIASIDLSETKIDSIGKEAFYQVLMLSDIKWPSTLKYIGDEAFGVTSFTELNLPASLEEIGAQAFYSLGELTSVVFNSPVKRIGSEAFATCSELANITFNNTVGTIESGAFADLSLETLDLKAEIIKSNAFANVKIAGSGILNVSAPVIEVEAFRNVTATDISLFTDVVVADVFKNVDVDKLNTVDITSEEISGNPFGTVDLHSVNYFHINTDDITKSVFTGLTLAECADIEINAENIAQYAFTEMNAPQFKRFVINARKNINSSAFRSLNASSDSIMYISADIIRAYAFHTPVKTEGQWLYVNINANNIEASAFSYMQGLRNIHVTANEMAALAFSGCNYVNYAYLNIPVVNCLGLYVGNEDVLLETVEFGENVKIISSSAFKAVSTDKCDGNRLKTIIFNNCQLTEIGQQAFMGCKAEDLIFPTIEGAEPTCVISRDAFGIQGHWCNITTVDLGNTVKRVDDGAFCFSSHPKSIKLGSVESLGGKAFSNLLPQVLVIPGTVKEFTSPVTATPNKIVFEYSENPLAVTFNALNENTSFEFDREIIATWTGTAKEVVCTDDPEHRFNVQLCAADNIYLSPSVATATVAADCAPTTLTISDGVEGIAVADGATLTFPEADLHIPASMKLMSGEITMPVDFNLNLADSDPDNVLDLTGLKFTADETSHPTLYCGRNIALDGYSLGRLNTWTNAVFGDNVTAVAEHMFDGCADLTTAVLNPSIKSIGNSAFKDCASLVTLELPENLETIDASAYDGCNAIEKVVARGTVPAGGAFAFTQKFAKATPLYVPAGAEEAYEDSDNFFFFGMANNIFTHADGGLIEDMEIDNSEPVDEFFTAGSQCHLPSWLKILYHIYQKVTGQGAPARMAALAAAAADGQPSNDDLLWVSSDPRIASIDREGTVTFHTDDPVTITAIATDGSGARLNIALNKDILGDVNKDGAIDVQDLNAMISGFFAPETISLKVADMNNDNEIDVLDVNILINNILENK